MVRVDFINENKFIQVKEGTKLADCIRMAGLPIETPCNGVGICGKCKVRVKGELYPPSSEEKNFIDENGDIRLACLARVKGDLCVELLKSKGELRTINRGYGMDVKIDSPIQRILLPKIDKNNSIPYEEMIDYHIQSLGVYERLGKLEREENNSFYGIIHENILLDINENFDSILGIALDIGTTGISAYLVDLEGGEVLNRVSALNPQTQFGGDVLSRITYCIENSGGEKILKEILIKKVNSMIDELLEDQYNRNCVYALMVSANTTMLHLFLGIDPTSIARAPYRPVFLKRVDLKPKDIGIHINEGGMITLIPSASGYVGADILSGVAATGFDQRKDPSIFIDIGTNGEIVAIANGKMAATSTAAGPALEGMNISCGSRAEEGAIDTFSIDEDFNIFYTTIGGAKAKGICGSGLIDIGAYLIKRGIVLKSGKFNEDLDERIKNRLRDKGLYITEDIYISQKDIRQIQLAKGAIAAGVIMLLDEIGISIEELKEVVIAGSFGYHINPNSIQEIGIIPKGFKGKITFVGNSSVEGARLSLINRDILKNIEKLKDQIDVLELSKKETFQEYFIKSLNF